MALRHLSRDTINLILVVTMTLCLIVALAGGALAIAWTGTPQGNAATTIAEAFAWAFAAAFVASFAMTLYQAHADRAAP